MNNNFLDSTNYSNRDSLKKYYDRLLKEAEEKNKKREEELQHELMSEDPLNINYARWATEDEFKSDLTQVPLKDCSVKQSGIPLLCSESYTYVDTSDSHSLIIGSSGSKKTRLFILPSILFLAKAGESMVVTDPKAELYERTSGQLKEKGYKVFCINFRDASTKNAWNPLSTPFKFFKEGKFDLSVGLLNDFASISIPHKDRGMDPFWDDSARATFMGLLLILFSLAEDESEINIRSLLRLRATLLNTTKNDLEKLIELAGIDSLVSTYLSGTAIAPTKTFASIVSTLDTHLMKFVIRPLLTDMLCHNDVQLNNIGKEKTAIFLVMPDEKATYHGLISLFIQQCYESLIFEAQKSENKTLPVRVNYLLDEFSSLPKIKEFPSMIAAARSRNIRFNIVVQSEKQLKSHYGEDADTIKGNCNNWIYLYSREFPTLVEISNLCGTQKSGKPLITTSRLQRLDKDKGEALIMHGRKYPFISYLKDINEYDHEEIRDPYHEEISTDGHINLFDYTEYMKVMDVQYVEAKLRMKETTSFTRENKFKEELYSNKICINHMGSTTCTKSEKYSSISENWYSNHIDMFSSVDAKKIRNTHCEIVDMPDNRLYSDSSVLLKHFFTLTEIEGDKNVAVTGENEKQLEEVAKWIYKEYLVSDDIVPIYYDMRNFDIPKCFFNEDDSLEVRKNNLLLLPLLIAGELFDEALLTDDQKINPSLLMEYNLLLAAFKETKTKRPEFTIILYGLESSKYLAEAIYQSWLVGSFKNVRLIVLTTNEKDILNENCLNFSHILDETKKMFTKVVLYFDETKNSVAAKQQASPEFRITLKDS